jgi:hypothetical protein
MSAREPAVADLPLDLPPPQSAAADPAAFELLEEIADLAHDHADELADAAAAGDRARARLHVCLLSRIVRTGLLTVGDLFEAAP